MIYFKDTHSILISLFVMNIWQVLALQFILSDSPSCSHSWFALGNLVLVLFGAVRFLSPDSGNMCFTAKYLAPELALYSSEEELIFPVGD